MPMSIPNLPEESEAQFELTIVQYAQLMGWFVYHTRNSKGSVAGFPDLVMARGERLVFVELKRENGKLSRPQTEWLARLDQTPAEVHVWRPRDWLEAKATLDRP